ncbi:MAG: L,D-transpeptidase [Gemmatimonadota bacterium]
MRVEEAANLSADLARDGGAPDRVRSPSDSRNYEQARRLAANARGFRVVISLDDRVLWVVRDADTIRTARIGIASGETLKYAGRTWTFRTPRGKRTVVGSKVAPHWTPPDWAYAEIASQYKLRLEWLTHDKPVALRDGRRLTVQQGAVGLLDSAGVFRALPKDEHIVFQSTLYVPPFGTVNRQIGGQLGPYTLDMGNGYLLHGGPPSDNGALPPTHGCIRLGDGDLEWLYHNVPKGTAVYIY